MGSQHSSTLSCDRACTPSLTALRLERMGWGYIEGNQLSALSSSADSVEAFKCVFAVAALAAVSSWYVNRIQVCSVTFAAHVL